MPPLVIPDAILVAHPRAKAFPLDGNPNWIMELKEFDDYEFADPEILDAVLDSISDKCANLELRIRAEEVRYHRNYYDKSDFRTAHYNAAQLAQLRPDYPPYLLMEAEAEAHAAVQTANRQNLLSILERDPEYARARERLILDLCSENDYASAQRNLKLYSTTSRLTPLLAAGNGACETRTENWKAAEGSFGAAFDAPGSSSRQFLQHYFRGNYHANLNDARAFLSDRAATSILSAKIYCRNSGFRCSVIYDSYNAYWAQEKYEMCKAIVTSKALEDVLSSYLEVHYDLTTIRREGWDKLIEDLRQKKSNGAMIVRSLQTYARTLIFTGDFGRAQNALELLRAILGDQKYSQFPVSNVARQTADYVEFLLIHNRGPDSEALAFAGQTHHIPREKQAIIIV